MTYLCESCGVEFESTEDENRKCPNCGSTSEDHIPEDFNDHYLDDESSF
jgi:rubrerythrin